MRKLPVIAALALLSGCTTMFPNSDNALCARAGAVDTDNYTHCRVLLLQVSPTEKASVLQAAGYQADSTRRD